MQHLMQYVPGDTDSRPIHVLCYGDQLSEERMVQAHWSMASSGTEKASLVALVPTPQEFHQRCISLQVV